MIKRWNFVKKNKKNKSIRYVHIPKTGGTSVVNILKHTNILPTSYYTKSSHVLGSPNNLNFTVIRHPVDRFESFLNYRLDEKRPRKDWPKKLRYLYKKKYNNVTLNEIVLKMKKQDILRFKPFNTIKHYSRNVDIFITIDKLEKFLHFFGYKVNVEEFKKRNVSTKTRGILNDKMRNKIAKIFNEDMVLYNNLKKYKLI